MSKRAEALRGQKREQTCLSHQAERLDTGELKAKPKSWRGLSCLNADMRLRDPCEFTAMAKKIVISQESWVSDNWKMLLIFIRHLYFLMRSRFIIFLGYFRTFLANRFFFSFLFIAHVVIIRSMRTNRVGFPSYRGSCRRGFGGRGQGEGDCIKSLSRVAEMRQ